MAAIGNASFNHLELSSNNETSSEQCRNGISHSHVSIAVHAFSLLGSLIGNFLLIVASARIKEKRLLLITNMAASDLLVAIFLLPRFIKIEITGSNAFLVHGTAGTILCKMCTFLSDMSLSVSTLSLVMIAVERFLAVAYPLVYRSTSSKRCRIFVASTWALAAAFHSPYFYTSRLVRVVGNQSHDIEVCQQSWEPAFNDRLAHRRYGIFLYTTVLILPLLLISGLYIVIAFHAQNDKMLTCRSERGTKQRRDCTRNLLRMAIATIISFLVCWTLNIVISFINLISPWVVPNCNKSFMAVSYIAHLLASCYCAVNPWLCFLFIPRFFCELRVMTGKRNNRYSRAEGIKMKRLRGSDPSNIRLRNLENSSH